MKCNNLHISVHITVTFTMSKSLDNYILREYDVSAITKKQIVKIKNRVFSDLRKSNVRN